MRSEVEKKDLYLERCERIGASFMPLVFETFGRVSDDVTKLLKSLVRRASEISHIPYATLLSYWRRRLSTALQVGNAEYLMSAIKRILAHTNSSQNPGRELYSAALDDALTAENCVRGPRIAHSLSCIE